MRKSVTFFILSSSGIPVRQFSISKITIGLFLCLMVVALSAVGYGYYDYRRLKISEDRADILADAMDKHRQEIKTQRKQIQRFATDINLLKSKLVDLNNFEKKIRIIADIKGGNEDQLGLFGVGGPVPSDLDTKIPLKEKYNSLVREMHTQTDQLETATEGQAERFASLVDHLEDKVNLLAATPAIRPTEGWTTCGFGYRKSPFTGEKEFHKGVDIANRKGTKIVATATGRVSFTGRKGMLGKTVVIDHGHGMVTRYGHLDKILVKKGAKVKRGETIALMGNTGRTTGSHIHYEVYLNSIPVNPQKYILN